MINNNVIKNNSPISMEEAKSILDMAIQTAKQLRERLAEFNKTRIKHSSLKRDVQKEM